MSGPDRHDGGGISVVTLVIAAAASASAAFVVSRVWGSGTLIGAAVTPIIVAVVTELLRRPATRLPDLRTPPPPTGGRSPAGSAEPPVHVYRAAPAARHWRIVALTALAAFVIGVSLYVVLDRVAGGSGRLVPEREGRPPAQTVTSAPQTATVVTQRTVTVSTVTVQQERTRTVTVPAPTTPRTVATSPTQTAPETQTDGAAPPEG